LKLFASIAALLLTSHLAAASYTVTTGADSGPGSFRQGLLDANSGACAAPCRIDFDAPATGNLVITPQSALPEITASQVEINGPLADFFTPKVILDGRNAGFHSGLKSVGASRINIHWLAVINFGGNGIFFDGGSNNLVAGCVIGTDPRTKSAAPNGLNGVSARGVAGVNVSLNFIDSNRGNAVYMVGCSNATVVVNEIGNGYLVGEPRPNLGFGVFLQDCLNANVANNTIANSKLSGIGIVGAGSTVDVDIFNRIYGNGLLGIDLGNDGPTPNDPLDADLGPNELQNAPVITRAIRSLGKFQVDLKLSTRPNTQSYLAIYEADEPNVYGAGQGRHMVAFNSGVTDANGELSLTFVVNSLTSEYVTAKAGTYRGPSVPAVSSEFSTPVKFADAGLTFAVTNTADSGPGTLRQALLDANAGAAGSPLPALVSFALPAAAGRDGVFTIQPATPLPAITNPNFVIDGLTQKNSAGGTNPAGLEIVLNGAQCAALCNGLETVTSGGLLGFQMISGLTINGFTGNGIAVRTQPEGSLSGTTTRIQGCYLGTDATGTKAVPNAGHGIDATSAFLEVGQVFDNRIDGILTSDSAANVIGGNGGDGIHLASSSARMAGNRIGVAAGGREPLGNGGDGIGTTAGARVVSSGGEIAFNRGTGVSETAGGIVAVSATSIHDNGGPGIDLGHAGPTANDAGDVDGLQNSPMIISAVFDPGTAETTVTGSLDAMPNGITTWPVVSVFASPYPDPSGRGEGTTVLVESSVPTPATGIKNWSVKVKKDLSGQFITATATMFDWFAFTYVGATSEFSEAVQVSKPPCTGQASPMATAPLPGATADASKPVTFTWTDAGAASYILWIRPIQQKGAAQPATTQRTATVTLPAGEYEWFVEARFDACYSTQSLPQRMTVR
jgi:Right handed beta helix region